MDNEISSNSASWLFYVKVSFAVALLATGVGIVFAPTDLLVKGYMAICALFLVSTTITLSKTLRDEHESRRIHNRLSEARAQQLLKEYTE
ncbi:YiaA/YiaB family inner membrane protein [Marinobacter sp. SS21]|uniref:YiaA/YiaB family inner membrane protein n=1 Tax=Marinobacter sp. SS21 TaxID=2979460 RepID=UPI00232F69E9|nr:YiaA/YiaB family inner membrane protein [Marinobacter sp. SS21]MDC0661549.1 YiaA/YiaB family inner membrane protein [Marinobacter sp. SS21]